MSLKYVFVVLTPYQLNVMTRVFGEQIRSANTVLFYTKHVHIDQTLYAGRSIEIPFDTFSFIQLKKAPIPTILKYRKRIHQIAEYIKQFILSCEFDSEVHIIIGTDKDNFTQVLLNELYKLKIPRIELHAVEEGLGYYIKEGFRDNIKAFLYKIFTPIIFGQKLLYHRQLGTDPRIDNIYVRLPQMLPETKKLKGKAIRELKLEQHHPSDVSQSNRVLIFSFPNKDYDIDSIAKKGIYESLLNQLGGSDIVIKPHPREETDVFEFFPNVEVLDRSKIGEELDYFSYSKIINFSSSVIIDILSREYPVDRIFTIAINPIQFSFFDKTNCLSLTDLKDYNFETKT